MQESTNHATASDNNEGYQTIDEGGVKSDGASALLSQVQAILKSFPSELALPPPVPLLPWLYLAPLNGCVWDQGDRLSEVHGITHVISTNRMPPDRVEQMYWHLKSNGIDHLYVEADDLPGYPMLGRHWEECKAYIEQAVKEDSSNKVLVHCNAGMNRSATIVAAAMMHFAKMDLLTVVRELRTKRGRVLSNATFVDELVAMAMQQQQSSPGAS